MRQIRPPARIIGLLGNYNLMRGPVGHRLMVKTIEAYRTAAFSLRHHARLDAQNAMSDLRHPEGEWLSQKAAARSNMRCHSRAFCAGDDDVGAPR